MGKHRRPRVTVSLSEDVLELYRDLAEDAGVPVSQVMERVLTAWVREESGKVAAELWDRSRTAREVKESYARLVGALAKVGNNLNQIAWRLNRGDPLDDRVAEALEGIERAMAELVREWRPAEVLRQVRVEEEGDANQG